MFVSLGGWCDIAWQIENLEGTQRWGPCNWIMTPLQNLPLIFSERFSKIVDERYLRLFEYYRDGQRRTTILNSYYGVFLTHEFSRDSSEFIIENWQDEIAGVSQKWQSRVGEWFDMISAAEDVIFVRKQGKVSIPQYPNSMATHEGDYLQIRDAMRLISPAAQLALVNPGCNIVSPDIRTANIRAGGAEDWDTPADYWKGPTREWQSFLNSIQST